MFLLYAPVPARRTPHAGDSAGDLSLPRFKVEYTSGDIYGTLTKMGMPPIREGLTQVLQKTYVKVDEEPERHSSAVAEAFRALAFSTRDALHASIEGSTSSAASKANVRDSAVIPPNLRR
jgi:hypothetical protein